MNIARMLIAAPLALVLVATASPAAETAPDTMEIVREALRADKKALVATNLELTEAEAKEFWPVYDRYQSELIGVQSKLFEVVGEYSATLDTMTDERAKELVDLYFAAETERARVRSSYVAPLSKILPGRKMARFFQIENKVDAVVRYETAALVPLVAVK